MSKPPPPKNNSLMYCVHALVGRLKVANPEGKLIYNNRSDRLGID